MKLLVILFVYCATVLGSCTRGGLTYPPKNQNEKIDRTAFAKGADVGWLTELEAKHYKFYGADGTEKECMSLLKEECGVNSIRLRVWVNPTEGWNNIDDVVVKARRADRLGLRLMIDFHFSDTWADPGHQQTPAAWVDYDIEELKTAVAGHVDQMLTRLKSYDVEPEWVQIGNETRSGMLYPLGEYRQGSNFAELITAGYDATKAVFPDCKVIVHVDNGNDMSLYTRIFGNLQRYEGKYDMVGMSLYPSADNYAEVVDSAVANVEQIYATYGRRVMICEVGMSYTEPEACKAFIERLMTKGKAGGHVDGIFYWEPESPVGFNGGYDKGCFVDGKPTAALDAFKE